MAEPENKNWKPTISVRLSREIYEQVALMAERESRTRSNMVELILREYFRGGGKQDAPRKPAKK